MAEFKIAKVTALPGSPVADTMYVVKGALDTNAKLYVTSSAGTAVEVFDDALVASMIADAIGTATNTSLTLVADIAARDALVLDTNAIVLVADATGDATVNAGAALYFYDSVGDTFTKVAEYESMDVILSWANIQDKPTSTVAAIDQAVTDSHTHSNKSVLDLLTVSGGVLQYDGANVDTDTVTQWTSTDW